MELFSMRQSGSKRFGNAGWILLPLEMFLKAQNIRKRMIGPTIPNRASRLIDDRLVMIAWTPTENGIRVISMRKCNEREQKAFTARLG
jgi:hypothetical protein